MPHFLIQARASVSCLRVGVFVFVEFRKLVVDELDALVQGAEVKVLRVLVGHDRVDDTGRADGDDVTGEHRVVLTEGLDGDRPCRTGRRRRRSR